MIDEIIIMVVVGAGADPLRVRLFHLDPFVFVISDGGASSSGSTIWAILISHPFRLSLAGALARAFAGEHTSLAGKLMNRRHLHTAGRRRPKAAN